MSTRKTFAKQLTIALLADDWTPEAMKTAGHAALGAGTKRLVAKLVSEIRERTVTPYAPPPNTLTRYILDSSVIDRLHARVKPGSKPAAVMTSARMAPLAVFEAL